MSLKHGRRIQKLKQIACRSTKSLVKPARLPAAAARYLTEQLCHNPAWVKGLKCVKRRNTDQDNTYGLRVFDELLAAEKGVRIESYYSLDVYPELIIYEGWINQDADIAFLK